MCRTFAHTVEGMLSSGYSTYEHQRHQGQMGRLVCLKSHEWVNGIFVAEWSTQTLQTENTACVPLSRPIQSYTGRSLRWIGLAIDWVISSFLPPFPLFQVSAEFRWSPRWATVHVSVALVSPQTAVPVPSGEWCCRRATSGTNEYSPTAINIIIPNLFTYCLNHNSTCPIHIFSPLCKLISIANYYRYSFILIRQLLFFNPLWLSFAYLQTPHIILPPILQLLLLSSLVFSPPISHTLWTSHHHVCTGFLLSFSAIAQIFSFCWFSFSFIAFLFISFLRLLPATGINTPCRRCFISLLWIRSIQSVLTLKLVQ